MWVTVDGASVMLWAVESVRHDHIMRRIVIRTTSGAEHYLPFNGSPMECEAAVCSIRERVALAMLRMRQAAGQQPALS